MCHLCDAFVHNIKFICGSPKKFFEHPFTLRKKVAEFLKQTLIFTQKDPISFLGYVLLDWYMNKTRRGDLLKKTTIPAFRMVLLAGPFCGLFF
tara:strand:+ start:3236 stop:3514 length:279 start_codon:yes stop_codon:yes gene_type:complete